MARLVREVDPDVLCLQETKVRNELFPVLELRSLGFAHHVLHGHILCRQVPPKIAQESVNGESRLVAIKRFITI